MRQLTRRQRTAAIVLAVLALCFITLDLGGGSLRSAHSGVTGALGSLYRGTDSVLGPARRWAGGVPTAGTNRGRIQQLEHENATLRGRLQAAATDRQTSAALARLQAAADGRDHDIVPARVIAFGPGEGFDWTVTLDAGTRSGISKGQTVTDGAGVVGRVLHTSSDTAVVLLAADPDSGVGARDTRTGQIGVASGAGTHGLTFAPVDPRAVVHVGDRLVTGPTDASSYVAGLAVGTVTAVRTGSDGGIQASVRPATDATSLSIVGVITDGGPSRTDQVAAAAGATGGAR